jgi:hypothetical protein
MTAPRSAFAACASGERQPRTGSAGSALAAWLDVALHRGLLVLICALGWFAGTAAAAPAIERPAKDAQCVEDTATMRRQHMQLLKHQRDETVFGGIRGARHSLKDCVACHASRNSGSVAAAPGDFCVSCHSYAAVRIDCFECHTGKPPAVAAKAP